MNDLQPGMILEGAVTNVTNFGAFVDIGVHQDGLVHISSLSNKFVEDPHTVVKAGDIVKVKVLEVDLQRKRIALTMRLDEQPGETNARRGGGNDRPQNNRPAAKPRGREAQPAGNSAMMDALAAAMGKSVKPLIGLRFKFSRNRRPDKAFTPHLAIHALPDIKMPEYISGIFIPQPTHNILLIFITSLTTETLIKH